MRAKAYIAMHSRFAPAAVHQRIPHAHPSSARVTPALNISNHTQRFEHPRSKTHRYIGK